MDLPERAHTHEGAFGMDTPSSRARRREPAALAFGAFAGRKAALVDGAASGDSFRAVARAISKRNLAAAREEVHLERLSSRRRSSAVGSMELMPEVLEEVEPDVEEEMAKLPRWQSTVTVRALFIGAVLGACFSIISLKLGLTTGVIPSLNIAAGLLGFFFLGGLSRLLRLVRINGQELTAQEVTVIQTCTVACYGMAFNGGFATYVIAMDQQSYENVGGIDGNRPQDVVNPELGRLIAYMFCISLLGIFMLVPLRRQFILKYELPYPSGTATGLMINSFFTKSGSDAARRQLLSMGKWFAFSFIFSGWKWVFSGSGDCGTVTGGFGSFPTFSIQAAQWTWLFDFSQNYVGVGMLCPQIVSWSIMFGAVLSWGIMWPLISNKEGDWYPSGLSSTDFRGLYGYKVFIAIAVFVVDGAYIICKLAILSWLSFKSRRAAAAKAEAEAEELERRASNGPLPGTVPAPREGKEGAKGTDLEDDDDDAGEHRLLGGETEHERALRRRVFLSGAIPWWIALAGYFCMLAVAVGAIPELYPQAKWYQVLVAGLVAPPLAFANGFGAGLTDWNMASLYGKLAIFIFAAWSGLEAGGVITGLAVCGVVFASVSSASDLMQDFRTGYLTLSSPRAMFGAQLIGAVLGCVIAPLCFWLFWTAFPIGVPGTTYFAPYGTVYRGMAIVGVDGLSVLPENCLALCGGFAGITICMNLMRDFLPGKWGRFVPLPMCMALPFYLGAWLAVDMCVGAIIMLVWRWVDSAECQLLSAAAASGLIAGDGIWTVPAAILAIAGVNPPICMGWSVANNG